MPHITVSGVPADELRTFAHDIRATVVREAAVKEDYVKVFYSPVRRMDGPMEAAADVYWMHRPQELCDQVAAALNELFRSRGYALAQITFTEFPGNLFYEGNVHY